MKKKEQEPRWVVRLRTLMKSRGLNPRSLSLKAGLNPTAVRDMIEGRVKFPRYDTVEALAKALEVSPARLMSGKAENEGIAPPEAVRKNEAALDDDDLTLLTEIIMRLQEAAEAYRHALAPQDFAAMVTSIYRQVKPADEKQARKNPSSGLTPKIKSLMEYERLRKRAGRK